MKSAHRPGKNHVSALNNHPKEAKSIIAEPPGKIKEVFVNECY